MIHKVLVSPSDYNKLFAEPVVVEINLPAVKNILVSGSDPLRNLELEVFLSRALDVDVGIVFLVTDKHELPVCSKNECHLFLT